MSQLTIDLTPQLEERLSRKAEEAGVPVPDFVRSMLESQLGAEPEPREKPLWRRFVEAGQALPDEVISQLPTDGARNLDHYLYGAPKNEP